MDIVKAKKATEEAYKALEKTPEFKAYEKATKVCKEAKEALEATPEYKDYKKKNEASKKAHIAYLKICKEYWRTQREKKKHGRY